MRTVITIILAAGTFLISAQAFACSCRRMTVEEAIEAADVIFWGRAISIEREDRRIVATIDVGKRYKGEVKGTVRVSTRSVGTACGFGFEVEESYVVFAYAEGDELRTSSCSKTRLARAAPGKPGVDVEIDLSRQRKVLTPVLTDALRDARKVCPRDEGFVTLTVYDNGEFDVTDRNGCVAAYLGEHLELPRLPTGYPFRVKARLRGDLGLSFRGDDAPLRRAAIREQLLARVPSVTTADKRAALVLAGLEGRPDGDDLQYKCELDGREAAEMYLAAIEPGNQKERAKQDADEAYARCAMNRGEWQEATRIAGRLAEYRAEWKTIHRWLEKAAPHAAKALPLEASLDDMKLDPLTILRDARSTHGWANDVLFLNLLGLALVKSPGASKADRELAANAFVRASILAPDRAKAFRKQAVKWADEAIVSTVEEELRVEVKRRHEWLERAIERERKRSSGR